MRGTDERRRSRNRKRLTEVGQRLGRWFTTLLTSRDLQESKARFEEAQCVAHVGYWVWNLDTDRVTWTDETYRIFGLMPQNGPIDLGTIREMAQPEDRETVFRIAEEAILGRVRPVFRLLVPNQVIRADDLAWAMVDVVLRQTEERQGLVFENRDIRAMVKSQTLLRNRAV